MATEEDIIKELDNINTKYKFNYESIKDEQKSTIISIVQKKDTVAVLPTGFGKTFCIVAPVLIMNQIQPDVDHVAIVISLLVALMKDQLQWLRQHNIRAHMISSDMSTNDTKALRSGQATILFTSPEALISGRWRSLIPRVYGERCAVAAFDEAHCISEWGTDFRKDYKKVSEIQNILAATTLALTATATTAIE